MNIFFKGKPAAPSSSSSTTSASYRAMSSSGSTLSIMSSSSGSTLSTMSTSSSSFPFVVKEDPPGIKKLLEEIIRIIETTAKKENESGSLLNKFNIACNATRRNGPLTHDNIAKILENILKSPEEGDWEITPGDLHSDIYQKLIPLLKGKLPEIPISLTMVDKKERKEKENQGRFSFQSIPLEEQMRNLSITMTMLSERFDALQRQHELMQSGRLGEPLLYQHFLEKGEGKSKRKLKKVNTGNASTGEPETRERRRRPHHAQQEPAHQGHGAQPEVRRPRSRLCNPCSYGREL